MLESMNSAGSEAGCRIDPRIRRTRHLLQQALEKLLETKDFESISVQDVTEVATLNRATFYDHYPDKFALLECMVARQFLGLLAQRPLNEVADLFSAQVAAVEVDAEPQVGPLLG